MMVLEKPQPTRTMGENMTAMPIPIMPSHVHCEKPPKLPVPAEGVNAVGNCVLPRPANLLVPFDFEGPGRRLLTRAISLANGLNATLRLLHVMDEGSADLRARHLCERKMHEWAHRDGLVRVPVHVQVRQGGLLDQVLRAIENIPTDLVAMLASREGHRVGPYAHNLAEQLSHWAPVPILTFTEAVLDDQHHVCDSYPCAHWRRILVPVDYSAAAGRALKYAVTLAQEHQAQLLVLHATMVPISDHEFTAASRSACDARVAVRRADERLKNWVARIATGNCTWATQVRAGVSVAPTILLEAKRFKADLIVMGTGKPFFSQHRRWMSGMNVILRYAPCQVLTVPDTNTGMRLKCK